MIIVTGAAGFIGSNIIKGLNARGITDILAVGDLSDGKKYKNLSMVTYRDYMDYEEFLAKVIAGGAFESKVEAVFHEGACSDTMEWDGRYMMKNNFTYSKHLLHYCLERKIPFLYASSAAVYGGSTVFDDNATEQYPLNVYGYSKWQFDQYVQPFLRTAESQIVGFRYFNVFGPHEHHKGRMASVAFHLMNQLKDKGVVKLFGAYGGYSDGAHERDFVFVDDVVAVNLWFYEHGDQSGIFNLGTGKARPFQAIADKLIALNGSGTIEYIPFPDALKGAYQCYTQANINKLRDAGCDVVFHSLEDGLENYFNWFHGKGQFFL